MAGYREPWWAEVDKAAKLMSSYLGTIATRVRQEGTYTPVRGSAVKRRQPGSLRHIDEVIRANGWYYGIDKDLIGGVFTGKTECLTNTPLVVAVARACHEILGEELTLDATVPLLAASQRIQVLVAEAEAADRRAGDAQVIVRGRRAILDGRVVPEPRDSGVLELRAASPRSRRDRRRPWLIAAAVTAAISVLLAAAFMGGVLPWPWSPTDDNPDYRVLASRPVAAEVDRNPDHCAERTTLVDNGNHQAAGSVRLRECLDAVEIWVADLDRDSRCVYVELVWTEFSRDRSDDACPAGHIVHRRYPRRSGDYRPELVSTYRP
ncbi:hypothetical protein SAMN05421504_103190 [Amycolatopsis xylanica]|uniref:Uncharacterized protein n=1 Tax=Amycolatopsis xylanica TaxID=589385 RepID=A0A1H3CXV3_9PSEU|nr:hypothetical protein [Amycolatopsis xylanica]SDX58965.1 hypothetical protein SAMN05421504_103190 [Amycolatopsis xylanica]